MLGEKCAPEHPEKQRDWRTYDQEFSLRIKTAMKDFILNTMSYLEVYPQRSNSESGFAADKKMLGWNIAQKRDDRIDNAPFCTGIWHNLFNMGRL